MLWSLVVPARRAARKCAEPPLLERASEREALPSRPHEHSHQWIVGVVVVLVMR